MSKVKPSVEDFEAEDRRRTDLDREKRDAALRAQVAELRKLNKELIAESNLQDRIIRYAEMSLDALPPAPKFSPPPIKAKDRIKESVVLGCACWHVGETINKTEMDGLNEYDFDVFCRRLQYLVDKTVGHTRVLSAGYEFETLHVVHLGDFVSGIIHEELRSTNCLDIVEQAFVGAYVTAQALRELAAYFPRVTFTGVIGNHGRNAKEKYFKHKAKVNWDYVAYNTLALLLKNQRNITFNIPQSPWCMIGIYDHNIQVGHGDTIKSWNSIPFYGLSRERARVVEREAARNRFFAYLMRAHFHTDGELQTTIGRDILVGSLKGPCEHGVNFGGHKPTQTLFGMHHKHGKTWHLPLEPPPELDRAPCRYKYDRGVAVGMQEMPE